MPGDSTASGWYQIRFSPTPGSGTYAADDVALVDGTGPVSAELTVIGPMDGAPLNGR